MKLLLKIRNYLMLLNDVQLRLEQLQRAIGRIETRQVHQLANPSLRESEFQVFSQWGEDGIIQFLLRHVPIERKVFVEFGVQNYAESNTRFLLQNDNWSGLVIDGSDSNIEAIRRDPIYWRHNLKAQSAFVTRDNINELISEQGIHGDIGLLSVDIDGNDYWVWDAIDCIQPRVVLAEYNSLFGPIASVTVPYDPEFHRARAHYSNLYWGASLGALATLAEKKGYVLVGSNSAGNNAFFVRKDLAGGLNELPTKQAWVESQFRESRSVDGKLTYLDAAQGLALIGKCPVYDIQQEKIVSLEEALTEARSCDSR